MPELATLHPVFHFPSKSRSFAWLIGIFFSILLQILSDRLRKIPKLINFDEHQNWGETMVKKVHRSLLDLYIEIY